MSTVSPTTGAPLAPVSQSQPSQQPPAPPPSQDQQQAQSTAPASNTLNLFGVGTQVNTNG